MVELSNSNLNLTIMRHEHIKMVAEVNIKARSIRVIELQEEIIRCNNDIEAQKKVIEEAERNIDIHQQAKKEKE